MYTLGIYMISISIILIFTLYQAIYIIVNNNAHILFKLFSIIVLIAAIYIGVQRDTYLPFLGRTAFPLSLLKNISDQKAGDIVVKIVVDAPDNAKVIYWASKPSDKVISNPKDAYDGSENVGVALVKNKEATFYLACPSSYNVPMKNLKPHVHYRVVLSKGMLDSVKTVAVNCSKKS